MKLKLDKKETSFNEQIEENKELLISVSVFLAAAVLFIMFVVPKIIEFPSELSARGLVVDRLDELRNAKNILQTANSNQLEEEAEIVTRALPSEKNFELILGAITEAATEANVQVLSYKFSGTTNDVVLAGEDAIPLLFTIGILGDPSEAAEFSEKLMTTNPVSETKAIEYANGITEVKVAFFYKPFTSVSAEEITTARDKTAEEVATYNEIVDWETFNFDNIFIQQFSTESASLF